MFIKKTVYNTKTSQDCKVTELTSILEQNFETKLNKARLKLISMMILALCKIKTENYMSLSNVFDSSTTAECYMCRIQRFMAEFDLLMKLISTFILSHLSEKNNLILVMDRTNWKFGKSNINILMLGVCYKNTVIPLMFKMLYDRGDSYKDK